jgi:hypothetical protein
MGRTRPGAIVLSQSVNRSMRVEPTAKAHSHVVALSPPFPSYANSPTWHLGGAERMTRKWCCPHRQVGRCREVVQPSVERNKRVARETSSGATFRHQPTTRWLT